jgi:hypothetical protein
VPEPPPSGAVVTRALAVLPVASTSPALVETADGARRVMKFAGAGPGPFGLLTELIALGIARAVGAPVPAAAPVWLPDGFPWVVGTDEFDSMLQRSSGWNLGIDWLEDARPATADDLAAAPGAVLDAIALTDALVQNVDRTEKNPNLLVAGGRLRAIDYDACLYLSRALGAPRPAVTALPRGHLLEERKPAGPLPAIALGPLVAAAPLDWIAAAGTDRAGLEAALALHVSAFATAFEAGPGRPRGRAP